MISFELLEMVANHKKGIYRNKPATGRLLRLLLEEANSQSLTTILQEFVIKLISANPKA